jgi:hypothetical protein
MKVFLGWSGEASQKVAQVLHAWLPKVIQSIKPYVSSEDIAKGVRWAPEIAKELQASNYGIICITNENAQSPWINFEAGALSREIEKSFVTPFLFNLRPSEIQGPLAQFQSVLNEEDDIWKLLESINGKQEPEHRLEKGVLKEVFSMWWPRLRDDLSAIATEEATKHSPPKRTATEILEDLLMLSQAQHRDIRIRLRDHSKALDAISAEQVTKTEQLIGLVATLARSVVNNSAYSAYEPEVPSVLKSGDASEPGKSTKA